MPIRKSNDTLFYLFGTIPVVWLALLLAQSLSGGLPELLRNLTRALEQPTNIVWTDKSLPTILICLAAYGMAVLLYRTNQGRTRDGEEHGSAAWATPASVNAQFAQKDSIPLTQRKRQMGRKMDRLNECSPFQIRSSVVKNGSLPGRWLAGTCPPSCRPWRP